jgi:hypothetical protein
MLSKERLHQILFPPKTLLQITVDSTSRFENLHQIGELLYLETCWEEEVFSVSPISHLKLRPPPHLSFSFLKLKEKPDQINS